MPECSRFFLPGNSLKSMLSYPEHKYLSVSLSYLKKGLQYGHSLRAVSSIEEWDVIFRWPCSLSATDLQGEQMDLSGFCLVRREKGCFAAHLVKKKAEVGGLSG